MSTPSCLKPLGHNGAGTPAPWISLPGTCPGGPCREGQRDLGLCRVSGQAQVHTKHLMNLVGLWLPGGMGWQRANHGSGRKRKDFINDCSAAPKTFLFLCYD